MEERKTAAIVLSIIAIIIIFYTVIIPEIRYRSMQTTSFKACTVHFKYFDKNLVADADRAANNKLALCLCNIYIHKPDTAIGKQILKIYKQYGNDDSVDYNYKGNLDSIVRNRKAIFDTLISVD